MSESNIPTPVTPSTHNLAPSVQDYKTYIGRRLGRLFGRQRQDGEIAERLLSIDDVATNADQYVDFYGRESIVSPEEKQKAESLLQDVESATFWQQVGYKPEEYELSESHESFLKENDPDLAADTGTKFWVVKDTENQEWLLKRTDRRRKIGNNKLLRRLYDVQHSEEEAMAQRVAQFIGYPVPETKLVSWNDEGFLAYKYVKQHEDAHTDDFGKLAQQVSNPSDVRLRPIFNLLTGSFGDGANQGIVDKQTGKYYAQDIGMSVQAPKLEVNGPGLSWREFVDAIQASPGKAGFYYGEALKSMQPEDQETLKALVEHLRTVDEDKAVSILDPQTPMMKKKVHEYALGLVERSQLVVKLYDAGIFAPAGQS